jgi:tetratricopeptide (TPR) repeat protein
MIRADEEGTPRSFTILAVLIGLAWASHPSSACLAPALVWFVARHRATLGSKGIARGAGIAAAAALGPTLIVLPLLAMREPGTALGDPRSLPELLEYAFGLRFMGRKGAFGFEAERAASYGVYLWEEFLAAGLILFMIGLSSLVRLNRGLLLGVLAWVVPYSVMAILFKVEGQHDCWLVAAWLPFHLMIGLGILMLVRYLPIHLRPVAAAAVAAVAVLLAVAANRSDLNQRRYAFAADYGKVLLDNLDRDSILILNDDDALAICGYLQRVKGERPDVAVVALPFLGLSVVSERDWYDRKLLKERPYLRMPDYAGARVRLPGVRPLAAHLSAFLHANGGLGRAVFTQAALPPEMLPPGTALAPAGALWKLVPAGQEVLDLNYWKFPVKSEDVQDHIGRARGIKIIRTDDGLHSGAQPYEDRLISLLTKGNASLGRVYVRTGRYAEAVQVLDTVMRLEPEYGNDPDVVASLGRAYHGAGEDDKAADLLTHALELGLGPGSAGWALLSLGEIREKAGRAKEAESLYAQATSSAGGDRALLDRLKAKLKPAPAKGP